MKPKHADAPGFRWNAGAWFGTQFGATCWLLICALLMMPHDAGIASMVALCFVAACVTGVGLWVARRRIGAYPALQGLLAVIWALSLAAVYIIDSSGLWHVVSGIEITGAGGTVSAWAMKLLVWLMFPAFMLWFHVLEKNSA